MSHFIPSSRNVHIIGVAALCWVIWKLRNRACFNGKLVKSPAEFICYACSFLRYWAGLQGEGDKSMVEQGADRLQRVVLGIHTASQPPDGNGPAMLEDGDKMQEDDGENEAKAD
jgi:hypothetical protein